MSVLMFRPVEVLIGMRSIARFLRISNRRVFDLEKRGAPIFRDENGVMRAEKGELWTWWKE